MPRDIQTVWDLFGTRKPTPYAVSEALEKCKDLREWCLSGGGPRLSDVRDAVLAHLPTALHVGMPELLNRRWLQAQSLPGPWKLPRYGAGNGASIQLNPTLEALAEGSIGMRIYINVKLDLYATRSASLNLSRTASHLVINADGLIDCRMVASLSDTEGEPSARFAELSRYVELAGRYAVHAPVDPMAERT
jgi:hypothetical protein